jgi:beta-lactamase class A
MKIPVATLSALLLMTVVRAAHASDSQIIKAAQQAESDLKARVGVAVLDTSDGTLSRHRADERFPMASTFKVLACAALLARADAGKEKLNRQVEIKQSDLVSHVPVTKDRVGAAMSLGDLCAATMRTSDNTAANKVLEALGGPQSVTAFARGLNDRVSRLDRTETALNEGAPGDPRDTTSPAAMVTTLRQLVLGNALSPGSRSQLTRWLVGNEVGGPLLRPRDARRGCRDLAPGPAAACRRDLHHADRRLHRETQRGHCEARRGAHCDGERFKTVTVLSIGKSLI